jgi:hypothetical protein
MLNNRNRRPLAPPGPTQLRLRHLQRAARPLGSPSPNAALVGFSHPAAGDARGCHTRRNPPERPPQQLGQRASQTIPHLAPRGKTPIVRTTGARHRLNMLSALTATGTLRFMIRDGGVNAQVFIEFCKRLVAAADGPVDHIVDGQPAHRANSPPTSSPQPAGGSNCSSCRATRPNQDSSDRGEEISYAGRSTRSARCSSSIRRSAASIGCADVRSRPNRLSTTTTVPSRSSAVST